MSIGSWCDCCTYPAGEIQQRAIPTHVGARGTKCGRGQIKEALIGLWDPGQDLYLSLQPGLRRVANIVAGSTKRPVWPGRSAAEGVRALQLIRFGSLARAVRGHWNPLLAPCGEHNDPPQVCPAQFNGRGTGEVRFQEFTTRGQWGPCTHPEKQLFCPPWGLRLEMF